MLDKRTLLGKTVDDSKVVYECVCCGYKYVADLKAGVKSCPRCSRGPEHIVIRGDMLVRK
jgi:Zn finger protein HypA/HybF involved in hydrogenase expression